MLVQLVPELIQGFLYPKRRGSGIASGDHVEQGIRRGSQEGNRYCDCPA